MAKRFRATIDKATNSEACGIRIPFDVEKEFGTRARVPVVVRIKGYEYRSSMTPMGGCHMIPVNKDVREGAGVKGGDTVMVEVERDDAPRTVTPPNDLADAIAANPAATAAWEKLAYTFKKEHARAVEEAKRPETRVRRIEKIVAELAAKKAAGKA